MLEQGRRYDKSQIGPSEAEVPSNKNCLGQTSCGAPPPLSLLSESFATIDTGQLFADLVRPTLKRCNAFSINSQNPVIPKDLVDLLSSPDTRAIVWAHLAKAGAGELPIPQRQALVCAMVPYVTQDAPRSWEALVAVTDCTIKQRDLDLYKALGDAALSSRLPEEVISKLSTSFLALHSYNVAKERFFQPWVKLFSRQDSESLFCSVKLGIMSRLARGEVSTWDHLLETLLSSGSMAAQRELASSVHPPSTTAQKGDSGRPSTKSEIAKQLLIETAKSLPLALACSLFFDFSLRSAVVYSMLLGAINTIKVHLPSHRSTKQGDLKTSQETPFHENAFLDYAEKVYTKLSKLRGTEHFAALILHDMENNPALAGHINSWRLLSSSPRSNHAVS